MHHAKLLSRPVKRSVTRWILLFAVLLPCQTGCRQESDWREAVASLPPEMRQQLDPMQSTPMIAQGIESPRFAAAESAGLRGDEEVIGVVLHGQPRAYPLSRMSGVREHVVNDHVCDASGAPRAFTVTYCDMTQCVRVLQSGDEQPSESLEIGTLGLVEGGLALRWKGQHFKQDEKDVQLQDVPHQRMSWEQWKSRYPETLVYAGVRRRDSEAGTPAASGPDATPAP